MGKKEPGKEKSIILKSSQSLGEGNFFDLPFIYPFRTKEVLTFYQFSWKDKVSDRSIRVYGNKELGGIPTSFDYDVLIALYKVMVENHNNIFKYNKESSKYEFLNVVTFTFSDIGKNLGWDTKDGLGGTNVKKIKESLERLASATIFNTESGGLYDISKKSYSVDKVTQINLIYDLSYYESGSSDPSKRSSCKIGEFFLNSLRHSYLKIIDYDFYLELKSWYSKKLYVLLNKWQGNKSEIDLLYDTLYQRIPLPPERETKKRNEIIKKSSEELVSLGYLKSFTMDSKNRKVKFIYNQEFKINLKGIEQSPETKKYDYITLCRSKYRNKKEIVDRLTSIGFTYDFIDEKMFLCSKSEYFLEYVKALLRFTDMKEYYKAINDVKSFVSDGMINDYDIEPAFYDNYKNTSKWCY